MSIFQIAKTPLQGRFAARLPGFVALMKPRVMSLAVFTAFVGLAIAPGHLDPVLAFVAIGAIAAGAGAAGVLNMWCDADIDAVMTRTARRPIPRGEISRTEALVFGLILACSAVAILALALNIKAAALRFGFNELGRFAVDYRKVFGESPPETLRAVLPLSPVASGANPAHIAIARSPWVAPIQKADLI